MMNYNSYNAYNAYNSYNVYNQYSANNYIHYQEGDLIIAQSKEDNVSLKLLKGIVIEGEIDGRNIITVKRYGVDKTYSVPTKLIIVHIPYSYPRFEEFKSEILSMSSEDGKEYERLYNIYKATDNAKYCIGDYILCFYKTKGDCIGAFRPGLVTKLNIDTEGKLYYEVTNIEGDTMRVYESDIRVKSTYEDYQKERREYEIYSHNKSEEQLEEHNENISNIETNLHELESIVNKNTVNTTVSYGRLDILEEKYKKTEKLLKLGISLLLGGI